MLFLEKESLQMGEDYGDMHEMLLNNAGKWTVAFSMGSLHRN